MHLKSKLVAFAACAMLAAGAAAQSVGADLARSKACLACHQVDSKRVGPPLRSVAERYAAQSEAMQYLAGKIRGGSRGAWGSVPMPAQSQVTEEQARQLAQWVLSLAAERPTAP